MERNGGERASSDAAGDRPFRGLSRLGELGAIAVAFALVAAVAFWLEFRGRPSQPTWEELRAAARAAGEAGAWEEAAALLAQAWDTAKEFPPGEPRRLVTLHELAAALEAAGKDREAEGAALLALREATAAPDTAATVRGEIYLRLARLRWVRGEAALARTFALQALQHLAGATDSPARHRIEALVLLARADEREGKLAEARSWIEEALHLAEASLAEPEGGGEWTVEVARLLGAYAELARRMGDHELARHAQAQRALLAAPVPTPWWAGGG